MKDKSQSLNVRHTPRVVIAIVSTMFILKSTNFKDFLLIFVDQYYLIA